MTRTTRRRALTVLCGIGVANLAGLIAAAACSVSAPTARDTGASRDLAQPSLFACGRCHDEVYTEWAGSLHHRAWTNNNVRRATSNFEQIGCRPCHSPMPSLTDNPSEAPEYRPFNQADGVHCLSCHGVDGGRVATTNETPTENAPCRPVFDQRLDRADSCMPCHQPTHQAFDEYNTSKAKEDGKRCADCHMPEVVRRNGALGRSHGSHGGLSPTFVRKALDWQAETRGGEVRVSLRNRCGHKFPGEIPSRSCVIRVEFRGDHHTSTKATTLRRPFKKEDRADNRLAPDETRTLVYPLPAGANRASVQVLFKPYPLIPDSEAHDLGSWTGERGA